MTVKDLVFLDKIDYPDVQTLREDFKDLDEGRWSFLQAFLTCKKTSRPWNDFYIFEDVVTALNYEVPDFDVLEPPNSEQLWHGIFLMNKIMPKMEFSFEVKVYAKRVFNEEGVYIYPLLIDDSKDNKIMLKEIEDKANSGPFPLKNDSIIDIQASHLLEMKLYHDIEMGKNISWLNRQLETM